MLVCADNILFCTNTARETCREYCLYCSFPLSMHQLCSFSHQNLGLQSTLLHGGSLQRDALPVSRKGQDRSVFQGYSSTSSMWKTSWLSGWMRLIKVRHRSQTDTQYSSFSCLQWLHNTSSCTFSFYKNVFAVKSALIKFNHLFISGTESGNLKKIYYQMGSVHTWLFV